MRKRATGLFAGVALMAVTAACGAGDQGSAAAGESGRPGVLAAFYPLQWISEKVGGPDVAVTVLTKPGVEPHDLELTPRQVAGVADADLIVYLRGVQPAVDDAVEQNAADQGFDAAAAVQTLSAASTGAQEEEEEGGAHAHEHEVSYDPHLWLDPSRLATMTTKLGERLATVDPAHAAGYRERAAAAVRDLTALDAEMKQGLTTCARHSIVTSHTAFGYLAGRYGLKQIGISGIDPDAEPSPARLAEVAEVAKAEKMTTIFTEALVSPKVAEVLAQEVGAKTAVLDPLESKPATGDYVSAMRQNLATLRTALGCT
ncbi:zinc ABC transporter substrate-binding protein [Microtetraspora sp. NBRC 13810]|uniref:metal ABC transporter substrate-binding protein n=1 Tax=Microtetraspora sp. NBRC 13810 TaxID=3030990 RepID=UPI0024A4EB4C|nr:metal ABC transporter substrate-binding protein [Microtetraspora sp. NBRC 13810]GLW08641.1 zinc ABC transporter substrate-binding protein [Microtetraspora sp. NBRC 13810]